MNFYKHYMGDYQRDTMRLSMTEDGAYRRLLDEYYATETPLPNDKEECYRAARATTANERAAVDKVLDRYFPIGSDGLRHNKKADELIAKASEQAATNRRIAQQRTAQRMVDESYNDSLDDDGYGSGTNDSPTRLPDYQTPEPNPEPKPKKSKERRASRFTPPTAEDVKAYCADRKNHVNPETFVDFYAAKGWKVGNQPMKDWKACVRTWEKREQFSAKPNGNGSVPPITDERALESYGAKLGIKPRPGELWTQFRSRVMQAGSKPDHLRGAI